MEALTTSGGKPTRPPEKRSSARLASIVEVFSDLARGVDDVELLLEALAEPERLTPTIFGLPPRAKEIGWGEKSAFDPKPTLGGAEKAGVLIRKTTQLQSIAKSLRSGEADYDLGVQLYSARNKKSCV